MVRNGFSIRRPTHIGQSEKIESKQLVDQYFKILYEIRYNSNIMGQYDLIGNMDETPICYENIYKSTNTKIDTQNVTVKNFNKDKLRITVLLSILSDDTKLQPLIIFKGETNKSKEQRLQNNETLKKVYIL